MKRLGIREGWILEDVFRVKSISGWVKKSVVKSAKAHTNIIDSLEDTFDNELKHNAVI